MTRTCQNCQVEAAFLIRCRSASGVSRYLAFCRTHFHEFERRVEERGMLYQQVSEEEFSTHEVLDEG